jgi:hypothetical protein
MSRTVKQSDIYGILAAKAHRKHGWEGERPAHDRENGKAWLMLAVERRMMHLGKILCPLKDRLCHRATHPKRPRGKSGLSSELPLEEKEVQDVFALDEGDKWWL